MTREQLIEDASRKEFEAWLKDTGRGWSEIAFAAWQAARQSNNVPVGFVSKLPVTNPQSIRADANEAFQVPVFASPQHSDLLEMARNHRDTLISIRQCFADSAIGKKSARLQINNARAIINKALSTLITHPESTTPQQSNALEMAAKICEGLIAKSLDWDVRVQNDAFKMAADEIRKLIPQPAQEQEKFL